MGNRLALVQITIMVLEPTGYVPCIMEVISSTEHNPVVSRHCKMRLSLSATSFDVFDESLALGAVSAETSK